MRTGQAFRPGTVANRRSHVLLYAAFAIFFGLQDFPAAARVLLLFGEFLLRTYRAPKAVTNALSSIRGFHLLHNLTTEGCDSYYLTLFRRALPLTVRHVPARAPPLPFQLLEDLCSLAAHRGPLGIVFRALLATVFFSMGRLSTFLPSTEGRFDTSRWPVLGDLQRQGGGYRLRIKWGKTLQDAANGFWVPLLPCRGSPACPVVALNSLLQVLAHRGPGVPLFSFPQGVLQGVRGQRFFTMRLARQWLASLLGVLGRENEHYTFHSLRRGACTMAAERGATVSDIMRLGGWSSEAVHLYLPVGAARRRAAVRLVSPNPL